MPESVASSSLETGSVSADRQSIAARYWLGITAIAVLVINLGMNRFPLQQAAATGGLLCYVNAYDETSYLQYDFSRATQAVTRPGQWAVTALHELGLSAGWINLLLDLVLPVLFVFATAGCFRALGFSRSQSSLAGIGLWLVPATITTAFNPYMAQWFNYVYASPLLRWVSVPQSWFLPLSRSPEPQFSLTIAAAAICLALRLRAFWPAYLALPFLYPFVAAPLLFCTFALQLADRLGGGIGRFCCAMVASYAVVAGLMFVHVTWLTPQHVRDILFASTHGPLVSTTGVLSLAVFAASYRWIPVRLRRPAFVAAVAPLAINNHQVLSGWFSCPHNFEANAGLTAAALVLLCSIVPHLRGRVTFALAGLALLGIVRHQARVTVTEQERMAQRFDLTPVLLAAAKENSANVMMNDPHASGMIGMFYPRQPCALTAYTRSFAPLTNESIDHYLWARNEVRRRGEYAEAFRETFKTLDAAYRYAGGDFKMLNNGRKTEFIEQQNVERLPERTYAEPRIFLVRP